MAVLTHIGIGIDGRIWLHAVKGKYHERRFKLPLDKCAEVVIKSYKPIVIDDDDLEEYEKFID